MRNILHWWGLALLIAALDQLSKFYINATLSPTEPIVLTGWFNLVLAHNSGAAFSFLAQAAGWQRYFFSGISLLAIIFLTRLIQQHTKNRHFCFGLSSGNVSLRIGLIFGLTLKRNDTCFSLF